MSGALGIHEGSGQPWRALVTSRLREGRTLLVLDNFEHVIGAAPLLVDLLSASAGLTLLVTSRSVLSLRGEHEYPVPPLALPEPGERHGTAAIPAVALFLREAQARVPHFMLTEENVAAVVAICHRLDGLPLAIELAASRIPLLSPIALLARLDHGLQILAGGARDSPARQRTMRATIAWSYNLLHLTEQELFRRLGIFVGGATLDAIGAVDQLVGAGPRGDLLDCPESLLEKNLIRHEPSVGEAAPGDGPRLGMLETVHAYALERLYEAREIEQVRTRHAAYYLALAEETEPGLSGADQAALLSRLEHEHHNLRAALWWTLGGGAGADPDLAEASGDSGRSERLEIGVRLAGALWRFWYGHGHLTEGRTWLERMLAATESVDWSPVTGAWSKVLTGAAAFAFSQGDLGRAAVLATESLAPARARQDRYGQVFALNILGGAARQQSDYERASAYCEEALALARELGEPWLLGFSLNNLAELVHDRGHRTRAATLAEESLALCRATGDTWGISYASNNLGRVARDRGDLAQAEAHYHHSLSLVRQLQHQLGIAFALSALGSLAYDQGHDALALALHAESLQLTRALEDRRGIAQSLVVLGHVARRQGEHQRALDLFDEARSLFHAIGNRVGQVMCLEGVAAVACVDRRMEDAARLYSMATAGRAALSVPRPPGDREQYDRDLATVRATLSEATFNICWEAGRTWTMDQAAGSC
jgi:predicted ATPase